VPSILQQAPELFSRGLVRRRVAQEAVGHGPSVPPMNGEVVTKGRSTRRATNTDQKAQITRFDRCSAMSGVQNSRP
jgi:hypothetical protein